MADIMDRFWSVPPVSRTIIGAMAVESILVYSGLVNGYLTMFHLPYLFKLPFPEVWRLFTSFLLTKPKLGFFWDLFMFWQYTTNLELNSPRFSQPGDFATFIVFVGLAIVATAGLYLGAAIFTHALLLAIVYIYAQDNRGKKVGFIFFSIPAELLPWAMLAMTLIVDGSGAAMCELTGVFAAHLYDFLTRLYPTFQGGRNYIQTPLFVRNYFSSGGSIQVHRAYGTSYQPAQRSAPAAAPASRGWTSGFSSSSWGSRGTGHRLGGD